MSPISRCGSGRPRASPSTRSLRSATSRAAAPAMRWPCSVSCAASSARTGTAISAAAVGVGARRSAAWSISVVSVSWPTAAISGMALAAAARTTISSLKAHRSSRLPPPRATIRRSGRGTGPSGGRALKPRIAAAIWPAACSPWTSTGQSSTWRGKRSARRWRMSRITAPVGEVTTPMTRGSIGSGRLRAASNRPSAASFCLRSSSSLSSAPTPATSSASMISWYRERPGKLVSRPVAMTSSPSSGRTASRPALIRQQTASSTASVSLRLR